jgi:hypothetical protein
LPNSFGLPALPLRMTSGRGLEQAENLAVGAGVAAQDARSGLLHHLPDQRPHRIDLAAQVLQRQLLQDVGRSTSKIRFVRARDV